MKNSKQILLYKEKVDPAIYCNFKAKPNLFYANQSNVLIIYNE